jgi:hypothetical protein
MGTRWEIVQTAGTLCAVDPSSGVAADGIAARSGNVVAAFTTTRDAYVFLGADRFAPRLRDGLSDDGRSHCIECVVGLANWDGE